MRASGLECVRRGETNKRIKRLTPLTSMSCLIEHRALHYRKSHPPNLFRAIYLRIKFHLLWANRGDPQIVRMQEENTMGLSCSQTSIRECFRTLCARSSSLAVWLGGCDGGKVEGPRYGRGGCLQHTGVRHEGMEPKPVWAII